MSDEKSPSFYSPPPITYHGFLLVKRLNGTTVCGRFPVTKKEVTIGRSSKCDIRILLDSVSDVQCSVLFINNKAYVRDKSVLLTTKVNNKKIGKNNFLLHQSDEIDVCGRKFVWVYANSGLHSSGEKSQIKNKCGTPRVTGRRFSSQPNTPLERNKLLTPIKSSMKTPSKTLITYNKTPIVVAASNMSHSAFNKLTNRFKQQNSTTITQSEPRPTRSHSLVLGRNIPLVDDAKITQRKSWATSDASGNSTSDGISVLDQLSNERLKRDTTPEFNYSFRYEDESVQFDTPESPDVMFNEEYYDNANTTMSVTSNFLPDLEDQNDNDLQSTNNLPDTEPELSTSRRDTYSIDDGPIMIKQISTPTPGRSILKSSKTSKANRTKSNSRMVQFARLPNTDGKIKSSNSYFKSKSKLTVNDDGPNETDCSLDFKKSMQFDTENLDDDLDGVRPLDISVSSLINSPILDNSSLKKSSKRGSRGNKVMSLVNSIEKLHNVTSPKNSIRASDLLSANKSKHENGLLSDLQNNTKELEESASSTRRINLENIFEIEDSLKDVTCNVRNETMLNQECSTKKNEVNSDSINITGNVSVKNNSDKTLDQEFNFASPLNLRCVSNSSTTSCYNSSTLDDSTEKENVFKTIEFNKSTCVSPSANKPLKSSDITDNSSLVNIKDTTLNHNNSSKSQKNSESFKKSSENMSTDEKQINKPLLVQEPAIKVKNSLDTQKDNTKIMEKNHLVVSEHSNKTNDSSKVVEVTNYEETPSMIVQSMSNMFNSSDHNLSTCTQPDDLLETYVVVDKDDVPKSQKKSILRKKFNASNTNESLSCDKSIASIDNSSKSIVDTIDSNKEQMDLHTNPCINKTKVTANSFSRTSDEESINTGLSVKQIITNVSLHTAEVNDYIPEKSMNSSLDYGSTENVICSVSKTKSVNSVINATSSCAQKNSNETELHINISDSVNTSNKSCAKNSSSTSIVCNDLTNVKEQDKIQNNSKQIIKSAQSTLHESNIVDKVGIATNNILCLNKPTRKVLKVIDISKDSSDSNEVENILTVDQMSNIENTLDTSIGKPQYESTPWTSSKSSKTKFNSTVNKQANNTPNTDIQVRPHSPLPDPDVWSQMMKDFNESVKKASTSSVNNVVDVSRVNKNLFCNERSTCPTVQVTEVKDSVSCDANIENNSSLKNEVKNNTIQCSLISSCLPNSATKMSMETIVLRRSPRSHKLPTNSNKKTALSDKSSAKSNTVDKNSNIQSEKTVLCSTSSDIANTDLATISKVKKFMSVLDVNTDCSTISNKSTRKTNDLEHNTTSDDRNDSSSSKSLQTLNKNKKVVRTKKSNSNPVSSTRRNLRVKVNNSESIKTKSSVQVAVERSLTSSDTDDKSASVLQKPGRALRNKLNVHKKPTVKNTDKCTSSTRSRKNIESISSNNTSLTVKTINPVNTRFTRSSTTLIESCLPKVTKNNKTSSPVKTKSINVVKTKKTKNLKSNRKTRPKLALPLDSIKTCSNMSEYESEDNASEPVLVDVPSKTNKEKVKRGVKENSQIVDIPTTRNKNKKNDTNTRSQLNDPPKNDKEKVKKDDFQSDDSLSTRRPKRGKYDVSTPKISLPLRTRSRKRAADTPVFQPKAKGAKRDTSPEVASIPLSVVTNSPPNQLSTRKKCTRATFKSTASQMPNTSLPETTIVKEELTRAKKRAVSSESSCDSAPSTRKMTRRQENLKETEIKKLTTTTHAKSKTKVQNIDEPTSNSTKVRFEPNIEEKLISPKSKRTRNATQIVEKTKNISPPPPRVLRNREKKK